MAKYNLKKAVDKERFINRVKFLLDKQALVDMTRIFPNRSLNQNAYMHILFEYLASEIGVDMEYVKQKLFKIMVNRDMFIKEVEFLGEREFYCRSSADLTVDKAVIAINRFKSWSAMELGITLPDNRNDQLVEAFQAIDSSKEFL